MRGVCLDLKDFQDLVLNPKARQKGSDPKLGRRSAIWQKDPKFVEEDGPAPTLDGFGTSLEGRSRARLNQRSQKTDRFIFALALLFPKSVTFKIIY